MESKKFIFNSKILEKECSYFLNIAEIALNHADNVSKDIKNLEELLKLYPPFEDVEFSINSSQMIIWEVKAKRIMFRDINMDVYVPLIEDKVFGRLKLYKYLPSFVKALSQYFQDLKEEIYGQER